MRIVLGTLAMIAWGSLVVGGIIIFAIPVIIILAVAVACLTV